MRRFFIFKIRAYVSDVWIGQAHNLPGITGVGENFLVSSEAGIKNDFAAAARDRAGRASVKCAPVFQRECSGSVLNFCQWLPLFFSSAS